MSKYKKDYEELIRAAKIEDIDNLEIAKILGISRTELIQSARSDGKIQRLLEHSKTEVRVDLMKALLKIAYGYYYENETGVITEEKRRATKYEKKWMPGDPKVAILLARGLNKNSILREDPKKKEHTIIHVTISGDKLLKEKRKELAADYVVEG